MRTMLTAVLVMIMLSGCDGQKAAEAFEEAASRPPSGFTRTNDQGLVESDDEDDWRISPLFAGKVRVDPAYPNPTPGGTVIVHVAVLEFDAVGGGLVLRARDNSGRLALLDDLDDATSPGTYVFQFPSILLARTGLVRLFILDRFGELISYGDLKIE